MTDHLKPVRQWLRATGATHVVLEGPRIGTRRLSVDYALAQVRTMQIAGVTVTTTSGHTTASITVTDPFTQAARYAAVLHLPTIRVPDGHDPDGRPTHTDRPCERTEQ